MQEGSLSARLGNHGSRMMTAHVVETSQHSIAPADDDDGFSRNACGNELAGLLDLLNPPNHLPGFAEDRIGFELRDA